jgi:hypothetical protein
VTRQRRVLGALGVIAVVALVSACGSSAPAGTATSSSSAQAAAAGTASAASTSSAGSGNAAVSKREKGVKFAECMRGNGVPDFPDPKPNGDYVYGVSVSPAVWLKAVDACKALEPPGALSSQRSTKQQSLALKFAQCVRKNGVPDFPDPVNGQPLIDTTKIPSSNSPNGMSILNAATHKCGGLLQLSASGGGGTGG